MTPNIMNLGITAFHKSGIKRYSSFFTSPTKAAHAASESILDLPGSSAIAEILCTVDESACAHFFHPQELYIPYLSILTRRKSLLLA